VCIHVVLVLWLIIHCIPLNCWQTQLMMEQVEELRRKVLHESALQISLGSCSELPMHGSVCV
jgi:hypothetical protein